MTAMATRLRTKSGRPVYPIGIGTWGFGAFPLVSPGTEAEVAAIRHAVRLGHNHIDTAEMYGNGSAERLVGRVLAQERRRELFIASKLWKDHVAKGTVRPAVEAMLRRLDTDYLDLLYIHAPWFDAPWHDAIPQIAELIDEGVVRYIGVSNFNAEHLRQALNLARQPIAVNQLHYSCLHQREFSPELRALCLAQGIAVVAYLPLERGGVMRDETILSIARQYAVSPAQVALSWLLAHDALPIPRAMQRGHIDLNHGASTLQLSPADVQRLDFLHQ